MGAAAPGPQVKLRPCRQQASGYQAPGYGFKAQFSLEG